MQKGRYTRSILLVSILGTLCVPAGSTADEIATVHAGPAGVEWQVQAAAERLVLTVSTPDGTVVRREHKAGETPALSLFDAKGNRLQDGSYTWELRTVPNVDRATREALRAAREAGTDAAVMEDLRQAGKLPLEKVQTGSFAVSGGAVVAGEGVEPRPERPRQTKAVQDPGPITPRDQVIPDDLIVQGSLCVGLDCVNNENFGFDTIRLKENNTRIKFEDTSVGTFPSTDWQLTANDSASGGQNKFSIEDVTSARVPFTVEGGATTNSVYVDSTGRVGFRTSTPVLDLHVNTSNTPGIRLEQNSSGGFTAQTWDIAGNEANFFVRDVTGGSLLPFRIRPGAPSSSIDISSSGAVGIGTSSPEAQLHIKGTAAADTFLGIGNLPASDSALNIGYSGASFGIGSGFFNVRPATGSAAPNPSLRFATNNVHRLIIDNEGFIGLGNELFNPAFPIEQQVGGARLTAGGVWQNGSSRAIKNSIHAIEATEALQALAKLEPVRFHYNAEPDDEYLGFISEDVPDLVATADRKTLSPMDVVAVLTKVLQEQQKTIDALTAKVAELEKK